MSALIDAPVTGCGMTPETGRLDFDLPENTIDKDQLAANINQVIERDIDVQIAGVKRDSAAPTRSAEVAPPTHTPDVRIVSIPGIDAQPCGGTHTRRTGEIGTIMVTKVKNKGRINRRVSIAFVEAGNQ